MIRYINKVEWCDARHLHLAVPMADNLTVYCADYMPYEYIPMVGLASLELSDKIEAGIRVWTTKLSFVVPERLAHLTNHVSFRLTSVDGVQYIMGLSDRPHPIIGIDDRHPSSPTNQCACIVNATLIGPIPALRLCSS